MHACDIVHCHQTFICSHHWQEGLCSYSVTGKEIWVMLRAELLHTGNIFLPQVQILSYSIGDNHTRKETINIMSNVGHFREI